MVENCVYCHNAPCTAACLNGCDPAKALRSIRFANPDGARGSLSSVCVGCPAPCERACPRNVQIRNLVLSHIRPKAEVDRLKAPEPWRLRTDFCGIPLESPFLLSSSVVSSTCEMCLRAFDAGWAGAAFKTVSLMDIHETSPRFSAIRGETGSLVGFKNVEQLSDHSLVENLAVFRRLKAEHPTKFLLASVLGRDEKEWEFLARSCAKAGADALELNFSCPNMTAEGTGSDVGQCEELIARYTRAARRGARIPIVAKLTPNVVSMDAAARAALAAGADGIAAINTVKSLIPTSEKDGHVAVGGYSGRAVGPIALRFAAEICSMPEMKGRHFSGMGGVETWRDALDFVSLGAGSVQVTTAVMEYGYRIIDDLVDGLARYLANEGKVFGDLVGSRLGTVTDISELTRDKVVLPQFLRDRCIGCGRCHLSCRDGGHQAISFGSDRRPVLDPRACVGCHLCILVCPQEAIKPSHVVLDARTKAR